MAKKEVSIISYAKLQPGLAVGLLRVKTKKAETIYRFTAERPYGYMSSLITVLGRKGAMGFINVPPRACKVERERLTDILIDDPMFTKPRPPKFVSSKPEGRMNRDGHEFLDTDPNVLQRYRDHKRQEEMDRLAQEDRQKKEKVAPDLYTALDLLLKKAETLAIRVSDVPQDEIINAPEFTSARRVLAMARGEEFTGVTTP